MRDLITLVNDNNHVDKYLKKILVFVYNGSIVNDRSNNQNSKTKQGAQCQSETRAKEIHKFDHDTTCPATAIVGCQPSETD